MAVLVVVVVGGGACAANGQPSEDKSAANKVAAHRFRR